MSGVVSYLAGLAAEECAARAYLADGWILLAQRWRGSTGEIDLILQRGGQFAIVEVKKSGTWDKALARIAVPQMRRIEATMLEFLHTTPAGMNSDVTCDIALVDAYGRVKVLSGCLGHDALCA